MNAIGNLICLSGPNRGKEFRLTESINTIGRSKSCTITIDENLVSRYHAEIHRIDNQYQLRDLGGKNGVYLNKRRLPTGGIAWLENGYEIAFAYTQFLFNELAATATSPVLWTISEPSLCVDRMTRDVFVDGQRLNPPLSVKQFELLWFLYQNQDRVIGKDDIALAIWPEYQGDVYDANIDRLVSRVRSRIEPQGGYEPRFISTVHGFGYRLSLID